MAPVLGLREYKNRLRRDGRAPWSGEGRVVGAAGAGLLLLGGMARAAGASMHGARGRSPDLHAGAFPPRNPPLSSDLMHPCAPGNPSCHAGAFPPRTPPFIRAGAALRPACAHCQSVVQHEHDAPIRASRRFAEPCTPSSEHRTPFQQHRAAQPKCAPSRSSSSKESELRSTDAEPMRPPNCAAFSK